MKATRSSRSCDAFAKVDPAALTSRRELEAASASTVTASGVDPVDVAAEVAAAALGQERADAVAQPGQVLPGDWPQIAKSTPMRTASAAKTHRRADR
jgi:hypothetical protein